MNVHVKQPSMARAIRSALDRYPNLSSTEIAAMTGTRPEYVRVVKQRGAKPRLGKNKSLLDAVCDSYRKSIALRKESEVRHPNREVYRAYCAAWDELKIAEAAFLADGRVQNADIRVPEISVRPIRGVNVRDLLRRLDRAPILGKIGEKRL